MTSQLPLFSLHDTQVVVRCWDQLVLVMAACDQPKSILSTFQRQLGKGVSKQVARSFVRLLGRMGGREASELVLRTTPL